MSIKKEYINGKDICKVKFSLPDGLADSVKKASVVGDFNYWDPKQNPLRKRSNGSYSVILQLPVGNEYQFRYLINDTSWENEAEADKHVRSPYQDSENSVISI